MKTAPLPPDEAERLAALRQTGVLDTEPESSFDRLTDLAAQVCGAPIALITLVDSGRQWFKSHVGLEVLETPRDVAFCAHAILSPKVLVVPDALEDERFRDNPLVTSDPKIRFYAGCPLVTRDGHALGTLCVIDMVPRRLDEAQVDALRTLARHATTLLELRRAQTLLEENAAEWERAGERGDAAARADALRRLGHDFRQLVEAREQAEESFRDLERDLLEAAPVVPTQERDAEVLGLLEEIDAVTARLLPSFGVEHPSRADLIRIGAAARRARALMRR